MIVVAENCIVFDECYLLLIFLLFVSIIDHADRQSKNVEIGFHFLLNRLFDLAEKFNKIHSSCYCHSNPWRFSTIHRKSKRTRKVLAFDSLLSDVSILVAYCLSSSTARQSVRLDDDNIFSEKFDYDLFQYAHDKHLDYVY